MIDHILEPYQAQLGRDFQAYLNHAKRVYEYSCMLMLHRESKKLAIAAAFHDLDIWVGESMNYLPGSAALARKYIESNQLDLLADEVAFVIDRHHQLTPIKGNIEAEAFRKADLMDLSVGWVRFNIPKSIIIDAQRRFPRLGFTGLVTKKTMSYAVRHPLSPFPMMRIS
ncbi:MAG: hypothetical protein JXQ90_20585 [Cyclobacteriaceae bacterium]